MQFQCVDIICTLTQEKVTFMGQLEMWKRADFDDIVDYSFF